MTSPTHAIIPACAVARLARTPFLFGRTERWTIAAVAVTLHAASVLYLTTFAFFYFAVATDMADVLHLFAPRLQSAAFAAVAVLHARGLTRLLFPTCCATPPSTALSFDDKQQTAGLGKLVHSYRRHFSRYGLFGLHGALYEMRVTFKQVFQVPAQAYQAYQMSVYLTSPGLCALYATILACDCLFVPCFLFSKEEFTRRWGPGFVDAVFDFTLSAGFPLAIIFRAFYDYFVAGNDTLLWDIKWLNQMIMMVRFVAVTNVLDMLSTLLPFVTCYISLTTLNSAVQLRLGDVERHENSMRLAADVASQRFKNVDGLLALSRRAFLIVSALAGVFLCAMAATSVNREACHPGCLLQTYPWFTTKCHCVMMRLNCALHPVPNGDIDTFIQSECPHVFDLALFQCDVPNGLAAATLDALDNLYSLTLRRTNTVEWALPPHALPPSLAVLRFQDQVVPRVPAILNGNVNMLKYLFLRNVSITANNTIPTYHGLFMLSLVNTTLTDVPPFVSDLAEVTQLELSNNRLTSFPSHFAALPSLQTLSLEFNLIRSIPPEFVRAFPPTLQTLYLDGNPIDALPLETDFGLVQSHRLRIRGTPMCDRLYAAVAARQVATLPELEQKIVAILDQVCTPDCNLGCHTRYVGTKECESVCLVASCNYDSKPSDYASLGTKASDCYGVLTGWEPS